MKRLLICTDIDRTLIQNGAQAESPEAKGRFARLVSRPEVRLAYVTGRHRALVQQAIEEFDLPCPDFAITDVGSTIYQVGQDGWRQWNEWDELIAPDWRGMTHGELYRLLSVFFPALRLQEMEKQNRHKLSFYIPTETDVAALSAEMRALLRYAGIKANLIWSDDEAKGIGLLDVLPASANKLHAIRFLMQRKGYSPEETVFAGDSGNDLDVLMSNVPSVLVANADARIKTRAAMSDPAFLYIATGGFLGMNGNYRAGILEGVAHFRPEAAAWLDEQDRTGD